MGLNAHPCDRLYGGMFPVVYLLAVLMQSYVFSGGEGKEKDVGFLLLKAKSLAPFHSPSGWPQWEVP
jgi:hypothetical protein